jgi:hypothetical protein
MGIWVAKIMIPVYTLVHPLSNYTCLNSVVHAYSDQPNTVYVLKLMRRVCGGKFCKMDDTLNIVVPS